MKLLFLIFLLNSILYSSHLNWYFNFEEAHKQALKQDKKMMVLLLKKISPSIIKESFMNQDYIELVNKNFIPVIVIKDQKESYPIEMLYTNEYPALFFLDKYELFYCDVLKGRITPKSLKTHLKRCKY